MSLRDWFLTPPQDAPHRGAWAPPLNAAPADPALRDAGTDDPPGSADAAPAPAPLGHAHAASARASLGHAHAAPAYPAPEDVAAVLAPADAALAHHAAVAGTAAPSLVSAAVLGRAGEAEPVAAAVALALRGRAPTAAVIVVGAHGEPVGAGGTPPARRLAARFRAHGFEAAARGRLVWASAAPGTAQRAARLAEPAVLAVTVALDPVLERALQDAGLAIAVTRDPEGPLAQLATASLACHIIAPLPRGLGRLLASSGLTVPPDVRRICRDATGA